MCGLSGYIAKESNEYIQVMNSVISHRGSDASSYNEFHCKDKYIALGHNRMSIIDLSEEANQPFFSQNKNYSLVYNGELYNYLELRVELESSGFIFNTSSDTEVVLVALMHWGEKAFSRFNGMWSLAYLDLVKKTLILSRDRFGEKPLYYCIEDGDLYFSSEIKAILEVTKKRSVNKLTVNRFLLNGSLDSSNETFFSGVDKVPASTYSIIDLAKDVTKLNFRTYWDISNIEEIDSISDHEAVRKFYSIFQDSVKIRLRSDVGVGVLLSGGLDSSAITYEMSRNIEKLDILSVISNDIKYSEEYFIDIMANWLKIEPKKINLDDDPVGIYDLMERVIWFNDEPIHSFSAVAHYRLMSESYKNGIKVVLSGQGADELLGGYQKYYIYYILELFKSGRYIKSFEELFFYLFKGGLVKQFSFKEAGRYLPTFLKKVVKKTDYRSDDLKLLDAEVERLNVFTTVKHRQIMDLMKYSVPMLTHYEDRMSMAHTREIRLPFLDYRLVEYALSLPLKYKMREGWTKWILRKSFEDKMPSQICWRKDKKGFTIPQEGWLKKELKNNIQVLFDGDLLVEEFGLMKKNEVNKFYEEFLENNNIWYKEVFNIISIEIWLRVYKNYLHA